jgi:succinate dehydrogenase/fumarate reductase cytochrome b subunit
MLWHETWGSTYRNYRSVAETPIAKQRLKFLMLNIVFHLLWHEAWGSTYRNYRCVAQTPIAKQPLMLLMLNIVFHLLWHEAWVSSYWNYISVAETPIAKQRLVVLLLNILFHLCCDMRSKVLHTGIIESSRRHPLLSNGLWFYCKILYFIYVVSWGPRVYIPEFQKCRRDTHC